MARTPTAQKVAQMRHAALRNARVVDYPAVLPVLDLLAYRMVEVAPAEPVAILTLSKPGGRP